jgi:hypothetical protein
MNPNGIKAALSLLLVTCCSLASAEERPCLILWKQVEDRRILFHDGTVTHWRLIEGTFPAGVERTNHITDRVVRKVEAHGGKVVVVSVVYTQEDLADARKQCQEETR